MRLKAHSRRDQVQLFMNGKFSDQAIEVLELIKG